MSTWLIYGNPFLSEIYPDGDANRAVDCLLYLYSAVAERLSQEGGLPKELSDALWMTGPAFTTSIASYQGALTISESNPVAALCQIRESLESLIAVGTDWGDIPADSPTPRTEVILEELANAFLDWDEVHDLPAFQSAKAWLVCVMPFLSFNRQTWPRGQETEWLSLNPYTVAGKRGLPDVKTLASVIRAPLAIGALLRWRENWISTWSVQDHSTLELSDAEKVVMSAVESELLPAIRGVMEAQDLSWPEWAEALLPLQ